MAANAATPTCVYRRRANSHTTIGTTAAMTMGLVASAPPNNAPASAARHQYGASRYTSAAHTASAVRAAAGPSPVICPVVHNIVPVVATSNAATTAAVGAAPSRRALAQTAIAMTTPANNGVRRGASVVCKPNTSPMYNSGRCNGPCDANTPRYGRRPRRMSTTVAPNTPSSNDSARDDKNIGKRQATTTSVNSAGTPAPLAVPRVTKT